MAAVAFQIGEQRTGLSAAEALDLVELLGRERNLASQDLARRIKRQADLDPNTVEVSVDVVLGLNDQLAIAAVLTDKRWPDDSPAFARLQELVIAALAQGE